jgi:hypothetical protein
MSKHQQIVEAILAKLSTLPSFSKVLYQQDLPFEYGEQGALNLIDEYEATEIVQINQVSEHTLHIAVEAIAYCAQDLLLSQSVQHKADLIAALTQDRTWGGLALSTEQFSTDKTFETRGQTACRIQVMFLVRYRTSTISV